MNLLIRPDGVIECLYGEAIPLPALGRPRIARASQIEPDHQGRWWVQIAGGPSFGPFPTRSAALCQEVRWLENRLFARVPTNHAVVRP
jgi:hypothetical protein